MANCLLVGRGCPSFKERNFARTQSKRKVNVTSATTESVIRSLQHDLRNKKRSAVEITKHYLDKLNHKEPEVNSFITINSDAALDQARNLDKEIALNGTENLPPLAGIPIAYKDNLCTKGLKTTAGSQILKDYIPPYDATAVSKLQAMGCINIGKTNMDEFGMGSSTENSSFKVTRNPWDLDRVPGGSSGGSAAAVASGQCVAALGSDTGGSIRQPASFCGIVGLKPTYGRVSRHGLLAYASSLDVVGPMASSVEDAALLLEAIAGWDPADATSSEREVPKYSAALTPAAQLSSTPLSGRRFGVVTATRGSGVDPGVNAAFDKSLELLQSLGAVLEEVSLPAFSAGLPAYYVIALSEASSNLSRYDGIRYGKHHVRHAGEGDANYVELVRGAGFGDEVKRRILMGTYALSAGYYDAYYKRAQQVRSLMADEMRSALNKYDALLMPTAPTAAYKVGEKLADPLSMYKGDLMTVNVNLSGLPGLVVPCGWVHTTDTKLPVGLQFVGKAFDEATLLQVGHIFEQTNAMNLRL